MRVKELYLHTSNRIESLAERLVEVSREDPLQGLLEQETVMTLNPGMARWLRFEIARSLGVSFGWEFPFPGKFFQNIFTGFEPSHPETGIFDEISARWELFDILDNLEDRSEFALLNRYCEPSSARRLQLASRLAWLYDQYLLYRPESITDWESGRDSNDWQAEIWRRLCLRVFPTTRRPQHIARIWQQLKASHPDHTKPDTAHWPSRISVFGVSSLPPLHLDILDVVSRFRPVHLYLLQPSEMYWADLRSTKQIARATQRRTLTDHTPDFDIEDATYDLGNPLLPSFGRQGQAFLDLALDKDPIHDDSAFSEPDPSTQLGCLQTDLFLLENRSTEEVPQYPFPSYDGTIQIHQSAGARREVESLWDYLVEYFSHHSHAQASDVLVMAPDIQEYVGHIESVFSTQENENAAIPYSIADQSGPQESVFISGVIEYLELSNKRVTALEVIELLKHPITLEAFRFSESDFERIEYWIRETGVVWGWDASHRSGFNAFSTNRNTWSEFRTRLSAGIAFRNSDLLIPGNHAPFTEIEGESAELAGRFLEFLDFLQDIRKEANRVETIGYWNQRLCLVLDRLKPADEIELNRFQASIESLQEALPEKSGVLANGQEALSCAIKALESAAPVSGYLSGRVTFCSLKPMRSIPSKVICLIGMDNDTFPRKSIRAPFDLLAQDPKKGDRNTRDEDKQFFLETLLAARERLFISYKGLAPVSDIKREPSIVVSELIDYLERAEPTSPENSRIVTHKRQSYDPEYFKGGPLYTYSSQRAKNCQTYLGRTFSRDHETSANELDPPLPIEGEQSIIPIESLIRFFKDPQKYFVTSVLGARFATIEETPPEMDSLIQNPLDRYKLQHRFAEAIQNNQSIESIDQALIASLKLLPPGYLERLSYEMLREQALSIKRMREQLKSPVQPEILSIDLSLGAHRLAGQQLRGVSQDQQFFLHPGRWKARSRIEFWVRHLLSNAIQPQKSLIQSLQDSESPIELPPIADATSILEDLLSLFIKGREHPLSFFPQLSWDALEKLEKRSAQFDEDEFISLSKSLLLDDFQNAWSTPAYPWDEYAQTCFGVEPTLGVSYASLSLSIWGPFKEALSTKGVH